MLPAGLVAVGVPTTAGGTSARITRLWRRGTGNNGQAPPGRRHPRGYVAAGGIAAALLLAACVMPVATPTATPSPTPATPTPTATAIPTPTASPTATPTATPTPMPTQLAFDVTPNPDADALFVVRDTCLNPSAGYELEYPEDWWTNTAIGDVPACSWFSPTFYVVPDPSQRPPEIAIEISLRYDAEGLIVGEAQAQVGSVDGQPALRGEVRGGIDDPANYLAYQYVVLLGPSPGQGPNLVAQTDTTMGGDYALNKAVLDRIMATLEFVGSTQ